MPTAESLLTGALMAVAGAVAARGWAVRAAGRQFRRFGGEPPADARLLGTWEADGDATVAEWRERRPLTDQQAADLRRLIGRMRVTWEPHGYVVERDSRRDRHPYRLIAVDAASAVVRSTDPLSGGDGFTVIHFVGGDTYWLYAAGGPFRDYFRRVEPSAAAERP